MHCDLKIAAISRIILIKCSGPGLIFYPYYRPQTSGTLHKFKHSPPSLSNTDFILLLSPVEDMTLVHHEILVLVKNPYS